MNVDADINIVELLLLAIHIIIENPITMNTNRQNLEGIFQKEFLVGTS